MFCLCVFSNGPSRYVADTLVAHNTIHDATYSGICAGWGWGMESYVRNIHIVNNSLTKVMQRLADGGGVYVNQISSRLVLNRQMDFGLHPIQDQEKPVLLA